MNGAPGPLPKPVCSPRGTGPAEVELPASDPHWQQTPERGPFEWRRPSIGRFLAGLGLALVAITPAISAEESAPPPAESAALEIAGRALEAGDLERAETAFRQASEARPRSPWPLLGLGEVQARRGRYLEGLELARRAEGLAPREPQVLDLLARLQIRLGSVEQALRTLERWCEVQPTAPRPYLLAALILRDVDQLDGAVALLRRARQAGAVSVELDTQLAWMLLARGDAEAARQQASDALKLHGETTELTAAKGLALAAHADGHDEAVAWLRRALALAAEGGEGPLLGVAEQGRLHLELGTLLIRRAGAGTATPCPDGALDHLRRAVELLPDLARSHYELGLGLRACGDAEAARAALARFQELSQRDDSDDHGRRSLGAELNEVQRTAREGRPTAALEALDRLAADHPDDDRIALLRAKILFSGGKKAEAVASARQARTLAPNRVEAHYLEGLFLSQLGRLDEAREALESAVALDPSQADALGLLAALLADGGDLDGAADAFERAFIHGADGAALRLGYAKVLEALGRGGESRRQMELYRSLSGG